MKAILTILTTYLFTLAIATSQDKDKAEDFPVVWKMLIEVSQDNDVDKYADRLVFAHRQVGTMQSHSFLLDHVNKGQFNKMFGVSVEEMVKMLQKRISYTVTKGGLIEIQYVAPKNMPHSGPIQALEMSLNHKLKNYFEKGMNMKLEVLAGLKKEQLIRVEDSLLREYKAISKLELVNAKDMDSLEPIILQSLKRLEQDVVAEKSKLVRLEELENQLILKQKSYRDRVIIHSKAHLVKGAKDYEKLNNKLQKMHEKNIEKMKEELENRQPHNQNDTDIDDFLKRVE